MFASTIYSTMVFLGAASLNIVAIFVAVCSVVNEKKIEYECWFLVGNIFQSASVFLVCCLNCKPNISELNEFTVLAIFSTVY